MKRVLALVVLLCVAACAANGSAKYGGTGLTPAGASSPSRRGTVDALFKVGVLTKAAMTSTRGLQVAAALAGPPACNVGVYSVLYETVGVNGEPATASAALYIPEKACKGPFPLLGYSHGTIFTRRQSLTNVRTLPPPPHTLRDAESLYVAGIYASHGYVAVATDYLGFGLSNYSYHPYLHAESEATSVIDAMRAARTATATLHVSLSGKVFLNGYSQGGHSTLATQRAIERDTGKEFDLRGVAPDSGMYHLSEWLQDRTGKHLRGDPVLMTFVLTSYQKAYGNVYSNPTDAFQNPYAKDIDSLLPAASFDDARALTGKTLPLRIQRLLQPDFESAFLAGTNAAYDDAVQNDLISGWTARAPLYFCGGSRDPVVNFKNSREAYAYFKTHGRKVTLLDADPYLPKGLRRSLYHDAVLVICEPFTRANFFDALK